MNERIKELAVQAGLEMCSCGCDMPTRRTVEFAELVVKECARVADDNFNKGFCPVGATINEHFGIE